jgi:hypothetical protein
MFARFLEEIGLVNTHVHLVNNGFFDFRNETLDAIVADPDRFYAPVSLSNTVRLIQQGQFAVSHIEHRDDASELEHLSQLFCVRDIRDALISHMRFISDGRRHSTPSQTWVTLDDKRQKFSGYLRCVGIHFVNYARAFLPWLDHPGVLLCHFETAMGDYGVNRQATLLRRIVKAVGQSPIDDPIALFKSCVQEQKTRTYSGMRSQRSRYFSPEAEDLCTELGVDEINLALGYDIGA